MVAVVAVDSAATSIDIVNGVPVGRFAGSGTAPVDIDQWTGDVSHEFSANDRLHGYYAFQRDKRGEPNLQGNTLPGFGDTRQSRGKSLRSTKRTSLVQT